MPPSFSTSEQLGTFIRIDCAAVGDGHVAVAAGEDVHIWSLEEAGGKGATPASSSEHLKRHHRLPIKCLAFDPSGTRLASGSQDRSLRVRKFLVLSRSISKRRSSSSSLSLILVFLWKTKALCWVCVTSSAV